MRENDCNDFLRESAANSHPIAATAPGAPASSSSLNTRNAVRENSGLTLPARQHFDKAKHS
jgi:hypothetical protein